MKGRLRRPLLIVLLVAGLMILGVLGFRHFDGPRTVVRVVAPNGIEFVVVQKCNWGAEPFTTSCYYRRPGGPWGWFYYDHQDWYWGYGRAEVDKVRRVIKVYRKGKVAATFAYDTETFRLVWMNREMQGAQTWLDPGRDPWNQD